MPQRDLRYLIGLALIDDEFKKKLIADPQKAAEVMNCTLTPQQLAALEKMTEDDWAAIETATYDEQLATSPCEA